MVAACGEAAVIEAEAFRILGTPTQGGILIVSDHASNRVPPDIDLGIASELLDQHIAIDIGVAEIGALMAQQPGTAAFQGNVSRLVCDFNRYPGSPGVVPLESDGHLVPGNTGQREERIARFFDPYHAALEQVLAQTPPALILSLHSFTPALATMNRHAEEQQRPYLGIELRQDLVGDAAGWATRLARIADEVARHLYAPGSSLA
jgi:predicted N-formylglutamate amidohydrolase